MRTADLDFIKVTEVGGIVRYSSKPEEGLCLYRVSAWRQNRKQ